MIYSLIDSLLQFTDNVLSEGRISWGAIITALIFFNKLQRNKEFRERDQRVERNQRRIMEHLGVEGEWSTQGNGLRNMVLLNYVKWFIWRLQQKGVTIKMKTENVNWITLIPAVLGAIKLILQPFGIDLSHITDDQVNDIANGVSAIATIFGIFLTHKKEVPNAKRTDSYESNQ